MVSMRAQPLSSSRGRGVDEEAKQSTMSLLHEEDTEGRLDPRTDAQLVEEGKRGSRRRLGCDAMWS